MSWARRLQSSHSRARTLGLTLKTRGAHVRLRRREPFQNSTPSLPLSRSYIPSEMASLASQSAAAPAGAEPSVDPGLAKLFAHLEQKLATTTLGDDKWYIVAISCLVAGPDPEAAAQLYTYLINQPRYHTSEARRMLVRRLREALIKSVSLVGVCKPIEAILAISKLEREEDRDYATTRVGWQADQQNHDRAIDWYKKIYTRNANDTLGLFDAHKDFSWLSTEITYGFYLSDRQVLDDVETELVVLPAIMSQNLPTETHWHIRGTRRIGVSNADTKVVWDCIQAVAKHSGVSLHKVPTVDDVEPDV